MTMTEPGPANPIYGELARNWKWMLGLGILMIVLGVVGLAMANALTIVSVLYFGVLALIAGIAQLIDAFKYKGWKSVGGHVLVGALYVIAGVVMIALPVQSAWWLTLLIGASFIVSGVFRVIMAFQSGARTGAFIFLILSGIVSVALGVLIFSIVDLPSQEALASIESAGAWFSEWGWILGTFVAIELLLHGVTLAALALAAKKGGEAGAPPAGGTTVST